MLYCGVKGTGRNFVWAVLGGIAAISGLGMLLAGSNSRDSSPQIGLVLLVGAAIALCAYLAGGSAVLLINSANGSVAEKLSGKDSVADAERFVTKLQEIKLRRLVERKSAVQG